MRVKTPPIRFEFSRPLPPFDRLNFTTAESTTVDVIAYPKKEVRGRVVDHRGNGMKDAHVHGALIDLHGLPKQRSMCNFEVTADPDSIVHKIAILPVPVVRGIVEDQRGNPAPGMIVELHRHGHGDIPISK